MQADADDVCAAMETLLTKVVNVAQSKSPLEAQEEDLCAAMESLVRQVIRQAAEQANPTQVAGSSSAPVHTTDGNRPRRSGAHKEVRKPWSEDEDKKLLEAARAQGFTEGSRQGVWTPDWLAIATEVEGRAPKQCRERLFDNLDPSIDHSPLTQEEEKLLMELVAIHGTKWAVIANAMPHTKGRRPGNQLKNNWNRMTGKHKDRKRKKAPRPDTSGTETKQSEPPEAVAGAVATPPDSIVLDQGRTLGQSSDPAASSGQKHAQAVHATGGADRKRQRDNNGTEQEAPASGAKASTGRSKAKTVPTAGRKKKRLRECGVREVVKQRLRKGEGKEYFEYRTMWIDHDETDATWESEATLMRVRHGPEKLVSAMVPMELSNSAAGASVFFGVYVVCRQLVAYVGAISGINKPSANRTCI